ncbi:sporulation delaying protein family toxin [Staphylococcus simulans]|uniref:sporulation delaying protein family toxin n=1 Tax=Staphylococcus simulans TaxID=1286 RepID=UPI000D033C77|nr:sporulation delaying protein family toxin [Staphylococcus simulans]MDQ7112050.1 sporulation delaying protein family toxin [Staphylococcus simulans]PTJ90656.1 sporulation delaying protein family toxin [Staphylococcus simulans]RIN55297.1 sporulation delaying protein family toxin [Staphylococcus simulans]RIN72325.1 sporulation delaying protein family toxin [Staphylococcus simulans]
MKIKIISFLTTVVVSLTSIALFYDKNHEVEATSFNGEDLYRGIIFGQGKVAEKLPDIWSKEFREEAKNERNTKIINDTVKYIKKNNPKYFDELKKAIDLGDEKKITAALDKGGQLFGNYAESTGLIDKINKEKDRGFRCAVYPAYAVAVFGAAVAVTHAAAVTAGGVAVAYLAVTTGKTFWNSKPKKKARSASVGQDEATSEFTNYDQEQMIAYIKKQLSPVK